MPIRTTFTIALTLAGAVIASGGAFAPAEAGDRDATRDLKSGWDTARDERIEQRDLVPGPAPIRPGAGAARRPAVTLRPSSPVVAVGAPISFQVSSSVSGFGHIYVLSASGRVQVWMENVPIPAGQRLLFPTGGMGIRAAAPAGREDLMLVVTRNRIDGFFGYETTHSPRVLEYSPHAFKQALTAKFVDRPNREWGYARTSVQVVDRSTQGPAWGSTWGWSPSDLQWEME
jgi:hypothetical protein